MRDHNRERFDRLLEEVLAGLPPSIHELLDHVPLHVEDYPSLEIMRQMGVEYRDDLCGLYTGVPLPEKASERPMGMPDVVTIYREGIVSAAADDRGRICTRRVKEEIRKTVLHELAHYHGIDEDELWQMGYG